MTVEGARQSVNERQVAGHHDVGPADPALFQLTQLAAAGVAVPAALRAAAAETVGRRSQRWLMRLAERLEQGQGSAASADDASRFIAAMAASGDGVVGSLSDYLAVREALRQLRRRTLATLWGGTSMIAVAAILGIAMQFLLTGSVMELIDEFQVERPAGLMLLIQVTWTALLGLLISSVAMALLLLLRNRGAPGALAEQICDAVPLAGGALAAIDLAEMSDALARLLAAGHTYPAALELAGTATASARLRCWLREAAAALRQGTSVDVAVRALPMHAGVLTALVGSLGPAPDQPAQAWRIAARSALRTAGRRADRTTTLLPPITAICAAATAWASFSVLVGGFTVVVRMLGGF